MGGQGLPVDGFRLTPHGLPDARQSRQHLLDFDRNTVAVDQHGAAGNGQIVGEDFNLVRLGGIQLDDGTTAQAHYLMNGHCRGPEDHHEIDGNFIKRCHWNPDYNAKLPSSRSPRYG
jgi:hypothetical protein